MFTSRIYAISLTGLLVSIFSMEGMLQRSLLSKAVSLHWQKTSTSSARWLSGNRRVLSAYVSSPVMPLTCYASRTDKEFEKIVKGFYQLARLKKTYYEDVDDDDSFILMPFPGPLFILLPVHSSSCSRDEISIKIKEDDLSEKIARFVSRTPPNYMDAEGYTLLHHLYFSTYRRPHGEQHTALAAQLCRAGYDYSFPDKSRNSALYYANALSARGLLWRCVGLLVGCLIAGPRLLEDTPRDV